MGGSLLRCVMVSEDGREWRYETVVECWLLGMLSLPKPAAP
jgi:hypothetical protein